MRQWTEKILSVAFVGLVLMLHAFAVEEPTVQTAQNFHQWGAVTLFNGLPSDSVRAIAQTPDGIFWFGTDNGLARFDGRRVQTLAIPNAPSARILSLGLAADASLWVGTEDGAFRYLDGRFDVIEGTEGLSITAMLADTDPIAATGNGILLRIKVRDGNKLAAERIGSDVMTGSDGQPLRLTSLARSADVLIVGTSSRSIMVLDGDKLSETRSSPRPFFVNALAKDQAGVVWMGSGAGGSGTGLFSLGDIARPAKTEAVTNDVLAIAADSGGGIWAGTRKSGLFFIRNGVEGEHFTFANTSGSLRSDSIYSIFVDRENVVWIGTNRGVCRFDRSSPFQQLLSDNANSNFVRSLFRSRDGKVLAGTNRGLFSLNGNSWAAVPGFESRAVYSIDEGSGSMRIGTASGIADATGKTTTEGDTRGFATLGRRNFAAVFGQGLVETTTAAPDKIVFSEEAPTAILSTPEAILIGTAKHGVFSFDGSEPRRTVDPDALGGAAVRRLVLGSDGSILIASDGGLFRSVSGNVEKLFDGGEVRDLIEASGSLWAATTAGGLLHMRVDPELGWLSSKISVEQGLPSEKAFALLALGDSILVGTSRGLVTYTPGRTPPTLVLERVLSRRLYEPDEIRSTIELEYPQNSLLVEVAGQSSRTFPEEFQYAFVLKNDRGEIIDKRLSSEPQFAPGNLGAGHYTIESRVFNRDLLASEPLILNFSVARAPFPWAASALAALLVVALIALVWAIVERRRLAQKNRQLAAARLDLANEAERERRRIARDLHDQTLADLRELMMASDKLTDNNSGFRAEIESVSTEIRRICEDLSPSVLENVGLIAALEFLLGHTVDNGKFTAAEHLEERLNLPTNVELQIYRIVQEALNNIRRHADAQTVTLAAELSGGEFIVTLAHDGKRFEPDGKTKGRGIRNIRSRAALIKADVNWLSENADANLFVLRIAADG